MANVHGLNDNRNNNNNNIFRNYRIANNEENNGAQNGMFLLGGNDNVKPREETFWHFLKNLFCPRLEYKSFIFIITIINISIFFLTIIIFGIKEIENRQYNTFLTPKNLETFTLSSNEMKSHKLKGLYRWITNCLVHGNFLHLLMNTISLLIFGTLTEAFIKTKDITIVYILSGLIGGLFSLLLQSGQSVGASISIYGVFGAFIAFFIIKWKECDTIFGPTGKCCMFSFFCFFIFFSLFIQFGAIGYSSINVYGHLGGLLSGYFIGCILVVPENNDDCMCFENNHWKIFSWIVLSTFTLVGGVFFYVF